ncbi:hypothetical protein TNCT_542741, partial [Trichonephila clavata]
MSDVPERLRKDVLGVFLTLTSGNCSGAQPLLRPVGQGLWMPSWRCLEKCFVLVFVT